MPSPRSRRLLRIAALTILPFVLFASYFCSWLLLIWLNGRTWIAYRDFKRLNDTVFLPMQWATRSDSAPAETMQALGQWAYNDGYHALIRDHNRHRRAPPPQEDVPPGNH
jgi:hypothetical protein